MKNKLLLGALLIGSASLFTACSDDNDSNPSLIQPTEFTLNTPAYINETVDLEATKELQLSWSQPKYTADNAPLPVTYEIQVSPTNSYTVSTTEAAADESGATIADYAAIARTTTLCTYALQTEDLNKALVQIGKWTDASNVPTTQLVYIRVNAYIQENAKKLNPIVTTNEVKINVNPYFITLKDADPILWYMVGSCIGSKSWNNDGVSSIGTGLIPLFIQANEKYDKTTGEGVIAFTGYFPKDGQFKLVLTPGGWDDQMNFENVESGANLLYDADGNNHNLGISESGYYTFKVNTKTKKIAVEKYEKAVKVYEQLCVAGTMNDWSDSDMTPVFTLDGAENHVWSFVVNGGDHLKIKTAGSWDTNWGYRAGLQGSADGDGNLVIPDGKYLLLFNDITGDYMLIEQ
jgi:hypothetical protein